MASGQLMCSSSKKAFVYVTNGIQSDGCVQIFFVQGLNKAIISNVWSGKSEL